MQSLTTVIFLCLYGLVSVALATAAYLSGKVVENAYGSQISLIYFLCTFMLAVTVSFPIAMKLTPAERE